MEVVVTDEKPLHVRVAEALGDNLGPCPANAIEDALESGRGDSGWICNNCGFEGGYVKDGPQSYEHNRPARDYDTNWCATGPLISRYGITLLRNEYSGPPQHYPKLEVPEWSAVYGYYENYDGWGAIDWERDADPLVAVCSLVVKLAEAWRLPK